MTGDGALPVVAVGGALVLVGVVLAAPVSRRLAHAGWTQRAPGWCLLLWQSVCLAAGFSVVAGLTLLAVEPAGQTFLGATWNWWATIVAGRVPGPAWRLACGLLAMTITAVLLLSLARTVWRTVRRRRAHRRLLDLLTRPGPEGLVAGCQVRVMDHRSAVAYNLPGRRSRLVLSTGLVDLLTPTELAAVLEHERAHLRARHDILIMPFQSWVSAFGRVRGVSEAGRSVGVLTEMLADDVAAGRAAPGALASALARVALERDCSVGTGGAAGTSGAGGVGAGGPGPAGAAVRTVAESTTCVTDRVRRLTHPDPLAPAARALIVVAALTLLAIPATVLTLTW